MAVNILSAILGLGILCILYGLLITEVMHRTAAALLCAGLVMILNLALRFTNFIDLINSVDLDTILLLMSMMMMVGILSKTGIFGYIATKILLMFFKRPYVLVTVLSGITAIVSAFIDNVTTVLLITPLVIEISRELQINPRPLLLMIVFASNIGGTATLIGDPPNILIGSIAKLGFMDFIYNLTPIVIVDFILFLIVMKIMIRSWLSKYNETVAKIKEIKYSYGPIDQKLLRRVTFSLIVVIILFFLEDLLGYPPAIPALIGISILMILTGRSIDIERALRDIDWSTLVFFMAMFIVVKGVEELGFVELVANSICYISSNFTIIMLLIVWISAILSAFIDNIPFVMTMIPVVFNISSTLHLDPEPLLWALSLGACLGGNGTLVGASANIVVAGIADKHGYHISFKMFMKYGMPVMIATVTLSSVYLIIRYSMLHI
mgnify:CR=1 FL=1